MKRRELSPIFRLIPLLTTLLVLSTPLAAAVRLPRIIGDHMVLQAEKPVHIWGWTDATQPITVTLGEQSLTGQAGPDGRWLITFAPRPARPDPLQMLIRDASGATVTISDILIGEVWLGSGQSNMVMELPADRRRDPPAAIRVFKVAMRHALTPLDDVEGQWVVPTADSLATFSWVLYEFGRHLHRDLGVPVGSIQSTWGGTPIQGWTPAQAMAEEPRLRDDYELIVRANAEYEHAKEQHEAALAAGPPPATAPAEPKHAFSNPGAWPGFRMILYNAMIHPLGPYSIRGFLWYQGENNVFDARPELYGIRTKAMVNAWRARWRDDGLPFYFVQLPPFHYNTTNDPLSLTRLWQGQVDALGLVSNSAMAPTMDIGDVNDIHPGRKDPVAQRLAHIALNRTYGRKSLVCEGPAYMSHSVEGGTIRIRFRTGGGKLVSRDGKPLTWFQIAGEDRGFVDADAMIDGDSVIVRSPRVPAPVAVRFGWANIAEPNLANDAGWPAIPFSTDRW